MTDLKIGDWVMQDGYPSVIRGSRENGRVRYGNIFVGRNIWNQSWSINRDSSRLTVEILRKFVQDYGLSFSRDETLLPEAVRWLIKEDLFNGN